MLKDLAKRTLPPTVQSLIRSAINYRNLRQFKKRIVRHTYGGSAYDIVIADPIAQQWYDHDLECPQLDEILILQQGALKPGALVFDLGAHQGVVALMLSTVVGPAGAVVALEANPHNARIAQENVRLNGVKNLTVIHAAIAASAGTITFNKSLNGQVDWGERTKGTIKVTARSIDDLTSEYGQPDVLWIDVEGFECEALAGAQSTLRAAPDCLVEVGGAGLEKFGGSSAKVLSFFPSHQYDYFFRDRDETRPFIPLSNFEHLERKRWWLLALGRPTVKSRLGNTDDSRLPISTGN